MSRVRVLAAGFAGIGTQDHQSAMYLPAFAAHPGFELVGVVGTGAGPGEDDAVAAAADTYGVRRFPDLDAALDDPGVQLVSVAAADGDRAQTLATVLKAGRHVLADKPMAEDAVRASELADLAAHNGVALVPAHHLRFRGTLRAARDAVRSGRIGLPWNVQADLLIAGGDPAPDGELANLGVYPVDIVCDLLALPVRQVRALRGAPADPVTLLLDHDRDGTSTVVCGRVPQLPGVAPAAPVVHRYRVSGSHGVVLADALRPAATVHSRAGRRRGWAAPDTVRLLLDDLHRSVTGGQGELGALDAVRVQQVLDAAARSLRSGDVERVDGAAQ